jgi:hypothetical protein
MTTMKRHKKNHAVAAGWLMIVTAVAVVALAGYAGYSYLKPHAASSTPAVISTAGWTPYTNAAGKYSLKYDPSWKPYTQAGFALRCPWDEGAFYLETQGATDTEITGCGGGRIGQISVGSVPGTQAADSMFQADIYRDISAREISVDGVKGMRYSGVAIRGLYTANEGSTSVQYTFFTNGRQYNLTAYEESGYQGNVIAEFDVMVGQTLHLN